MASLLDAAFEGQDADDAAHRKAKRLALLADVLA